MEARLRRTPVEWGARAWVAVMLLAACGPGPNGRPRAPDCAPGFEASPSEPVCLPRFAAGCPAGTRLALGRTDCRDVGWRDCPDGFEPAPDGWGCREVIAPGPCTGARFRQLGSTECVSVGDCTTPFPPALASRFVDDDYTDAELDSSHFRTIGEAVAAAPAAGTIAIYPGTYAESIQLRRPVRLVGQCPEWVALTDGIPGQPGLAVAGAEAYVSGLRIVGHDVGIAVVEAGTLTAESVALLSNRGSGIGVYGAGTELTLTDSLVRGALPLPGQYPGIGIAFGDGATGTLDRVVVSGAQEVGLVVGGDGISVSVDRSVIRDTPGTPGTNLGSGVHVEGVGSRLVVTRSLVLDNVAYGVSAVRAGSFRLEQSVVRGTRTNADWVNGVGVTTQQQATAELLDVLIAGSEGSALVVSDATSRMDVERLTIVGAAPSPAGPSVGVQATEGALLEARDVAIVDAGMVGLLAHGAGSGVTASGVLVSGTRGIVGQSPGRGIGSERGASMALGDAAIVGSEGFGALVFGDDAQAHLTSVLFHLTRGWFDVANEREVGRGISVGNARLHLESSAVIDAAGIGILVDAEMTEAWLTDVTVSGVRAQSAGTEVHGHGLMVVRSALAHARRLTVHQSEAIGVAVMRSGLVLDDSAIVGNLVGVHAQDGVTISPVDTVSEAPTLGELEVSDSTRFESNGTRVGSGLVPLPPPDTPGG